MTGHNKSKEELIIELEQLKQENSEIKQDINSFRKKIMNCEAIFESSPIAMFIIDETTNIVMVNLAAVKLCGGNEEEILQHRPGNALRCVHSTKDPRGCGFSLDCKTCEVRNAIEALIAKGGAVNGAELEFSLNHDGVPQKVWMNVGVEPVIKDGEKHWCIAMSDITKSKQIEESLRISEERFRGIFNNLQDAFFQADLSGNFTMVSPSALRMYGCDSTEELIGMSASNLYAHVDVRNRLIAELQSKGQINDFVCEGKRKDGTTFWVSMNIRLIYQNGKVLGTEGIVRDISDRKLAEEKIKDSEFKYRYIFDNALEGIYRTSIDGKALMANASLVNMLGFGSVDEYLTEMNDSAHQVWYNADERADYIALLEKQDIVKGYECQLKRKDGTTLWTLLNAKLVRDENGNALYSDGFITDITNRKLAEEALAIAKSKAEENELRLQGILDNMLDAFFQVDLQGKVTYANTAALSLFGYNSIDEMLGIPASTFYAVVEERDELIETLQKTGKKIDWNGQGLRKDGTTFWASMNASVICGINGKAIGTQGVARDVTERKLAEYKVAEQLDELKRWYDITSDREFRLLELKQEVNELLIKEGKPPRYENV